MEGMKEAQLLWKGEFNNGAMNVNWVGLEYDNDKIKSKSWFSAEKDPRYDINWAWRMCSGSTLAFSKNGVLTNLSGAKGLNVGLAGSFKDTGVQYGVHWSTE